jgi:hypothetical protein
MFVGLVNLFGFPTRARGHGKEVSLAELVNPQHSCHCPYFSVPTAKADIANL